MAVEVVMPKFGLTMTEGTIQQWFKAEGDAITAGEALFEVETEKVLYEIEAPADGTVAKLLYPVEAVVGVGLPVAVLAEAGEGVAEIAARYADAAGAQAAPPPTATPQPEAAPAAESAASAERPKRVPVTPAARKLAKEHGIDLDRVTGSGPRGRITREDVQKIIDGGGQPAPGATPAPPADETQPLRGMRKVIAERMHQSLQGSAQLTITSEVDVSQLIDRRQAVRQEFGVTYTDFIVQACAHALRQHPRMNATLEDGTLRLNRGIHVGLAVALDEGLIVPVVRDTDRKSLKEVAGEAKTLAEKARAGQLTLEDVSGGTFTVSNLGMYGVDTFTPILNTPQTGILGVGRIVEKPALYRGEIAKRSTMVLSLTFDHRVIDGAPAGAFLQTVADLLAHGNRISLDAR